MRHVPSIRGWLHLPLTVLLLAPIASAQDDLGSLLDAGARKLSAEEWKERVVQTVVVGHTASGGNSEVMYAANGVLQGVETHPLFTGLPLGKIYGEWAVDDRGRICMKNLRIGKVAIADRCQYWFTYGGSLFVAESDSNRGALALARVVKP